MAHQGWKFIRDVGYHYFVDRKSLCGYFTLTTRNTVFSKSFDKDEACEKCSKLAPCSSSNLSPSKESQTQTENTSPGGSEPKAASS